MNNLTRWESYTPVSIGFEDMFKRLDALAANPTTNYPPYNLVKLDDEKQQLQLALAGFSREDIEVLGRSGLGVLHSAINEYRLGKFMSEYDEVIARKLAYVMCGGDLTSPQQVSEQYLLDIEREAFMSLLGNQKTLDRIQYLLMNNKPLRN